METKRLLWLMALTFAVVWLVQYCELPYGYVLSSVLSLGKSEVTAGSLKGRNSSSDAKSLGNQMFSNASNSSKMNDEQGLNTTVLSNGNDAQHDLKSAIDKHSDELLGANSSRDFLKITENSTVERVVRDKSSVPEMTGDEHNLPVSNDVSVSDASKSKDSFSDKNAVTAVTNNGEKSLHERTQVSVTRFNSLSHFKGQEHMNPNRSTHGFYLNATASSVNNSASKILLNNDKPESRQSNLSSLGNSSSISSTPIQKRRFKGPPAVVVPISEMNDMLPQSHVSYRFMRPQWVSKADQELITAKASIENAQVKETDPHTDVTAYRNFSAFVRSYELMEKTLKIYIYAEGEKPIFHQPELYGIYASEGWFMKQLEENKHFVTKDASKAHLFYLPFSSRILEETLYIPNSHSRKNLVQYLSSYIQSITTKYHFWNRTDGADHFLVACHDWAPAETSRIMKNCIRSLCNADVKGGFEFSKDVSLPETYVRYPENPLKGLGGKPPSERHILAFFAGKLHGYLRPILLKYWGNKDSDMKIFGKLNGTQGQKTYIQYMKSSKFCISAKGYEPYTPRVVEAIFYECVPVILSDNYVPPFFETLNWESFSVFILEKDIPNLKNILLSIPEKRYLEMQQRVRQVQKHFLWHKTPVKYDVFHMILHSIWHTRVFQMK